MKGCFKIRTFIGIRFDRELKNEIKLLQQKFAKYVTQGRWEDIENFHLTLKFLGEIHSSKRAQIDKKIEFIATKYSPFSLNGSDLGVFESSDVIRVLWLGLTGDLQGLNKLQKIIEQEMTSMGFLPEKRTYQPHITLGRNFVFKDDIKVILKELGTLKSCSFKVDRIYLFKSEQVQNRHVYSTLSEHILADDKG